MNDAALTRDEIRAKIFGSKQSEGVVLDVYGTQLELRPPSLGALLDAQDYEDTKAAVAHMIIEYSYVPGTSVKVFEEADVEQLLALSFSEDLRRIQQAITELTGVNMDKAKEEIKSPLEGTS